jgi:hypothetical protein
MNDFSAPPVPELSGMWIAAHRNRLVREIATPHRPHVWRRFALRGGGALAAVGASTAAVLVVVVGARAPNAFAGWSATPTQPASGQTASALSRCAAQVARSAGGQSDMPAGRWQPVLTDTRGPFTTMILHSAGATATCLTGPSFTTTAANSARAGGWPHMTGPVASHPHTGSSHVLSVGSATAGRPEVSVMGIPMPSSGPISQASQTRLTADGGQPYTLVQGQVRTGVTSATLVLSNGKDVQATIADGSLVAWWPGSATATSARASSGSAVTTQQLTFTPVAPPQAPASASSSSSSSR